MEKRRACADSPVENTAGAGEEPEESGWTEYFEDFSSEIYRESSFCSSVGSSSTVVSDAAGDWKLADGGFVIVDAPMKLRFFKKTRTHKNFQDDSLEDTATSPVHSPKVGDSRVRSCDVNPRFHHMKINSSLGRERKSENYSSEISSEKQEFAELKKRGLCLFPLSMLLN